MGDGAAQATPTARGGVAQSRHGAPKNAGEVYTSLPLSPTSWTVDFDACDSTGAIVEYAWTVEGQVETSSGDCDGFTHAFPDEGRYDVSLTVRDGGGASRTLTREVVVDDLLIVALGDSYGSGEGVPDELVPTELLDLARTRQAARDAAAAARNAAQESFLDEQDDYEATADQLDAVLDAQDAYLAARAARQAACPLPPGACAEATAAEAQAASDFASALADIGLSNLGITQTTAIRNVIADLRDAAEALLDVAGDALDAAVAALQAAEDELDAALAALEPLWQNRRCPDGQRSEGRDEDGDERPEVLHDGQAPRLEGYLGCGPLRRRRRASSGTVARAPRLPASVPGSGTACTTACA